MNNLNIAEIIFNSQRQCHNVLKLALPILNVTTVKTVLFVRFDLPNQMEAVSTHPSFVDKIYRNPAWVQSPIIQKLLSHISDQGYLCQLQVDSNCVWSRILKAQDIEKSILLVKKIDGYYCLWLYGVFKNYRSHKNDFIEEVESLKIFSNNFYKLAMPTLRRLVMYPYYLSKALPINNNEKDYLNTLIEKTPLEQFSIVYNKQQKLLTYTQALCLHHLSLGKTAKQIAREVDLSPRTVEKHFDNLKLSFNVGNRKALVSIFQSSREFWL